MSSSTTSNPAPDMNNNLSTDPSDKMFAPPKFVLQSDASHSSLRNDEDDEDEIPSNLMNSRSNVPGMTPQELLAAHRRSLAEFAQPRRGSNPTDLHSLTLSRLQVVSGEGVSHADVHGCVGEEEYQACLRSFKFGDGDDEEAGTGTNSCSILVGGDNVTTKNIVKR